jgi:hypothetical protein
MAYRPSPEDLDRPFTKEELAAEQRKLASAPLSALLDVYLQAYKNCEYRGDRTPRAKNIQLLVTAWKLIWKLKRRRPPRRD